MIVNEVIEHIEPALTGRTIRVERDDDYAPWSDPASTPALIRNQGGPMERYITRSTFDLWLFTQQNPTGAQIENLFTEAKSVVEYLILNYETGRIYNIEIVAGPSGPYRDGQNRRSVGITFTVSRSTGN